MFQRLRDTGRLQLSILLISMTVFCIFLSWFRMYMTGTKHFLFLNWNLMLAFIPWLTSTLLIITQRKGKVWLALLLGIWLIFFPNSPYILTDLFHLSWKNSAPIWFDLVLILSFAWTGLIYGFVSLADVELQLRNYLSKRTAQLSLIFLLFLSSFGIYLGRFLRWNSWDIIQNPSGLLMDILDRIIHPFDHPVTWGMTILMGFLLNIMYWSIQLMRRTYVNRA